MYIGQYKLDSLKMADKCNSVRLTPQQQWMPGIVAQAPDTSTHVKKAGRY